MPIDDDLVRSLPVQPGMVIAGKYRVERFLAAGGMGAVLRAHHEILDKPVAIKIIRPELATRTELAQRFLREARAAAKISSDYVARVTDVDLLDGKTPYMVMDFLDGEDLHDAMVAQGKMPVGLAVDIVLQALMGLDAAHAKGVVHRDLKPSNLFLERRDDGSRRVKLLDFGISKVIEGEGDDGLKAGATTSAGQMLGTPRYMSPEQVTSAKSVDHRTDLWAIGVILYEMLTGTYPFDGSSSGQILANILTTSVPPLRERREDASLELEAVLSRCLAKDRSDRFPGVRTMMAALAPFASKRMRALVAEYEEVAGDPIATMKSPDAVRSPPTPVSGGEPVDSAPTRLASVAMKKTEAAGPPTPAVRTHVSAEGPPASKSSVPAPAHSTETSMSVVESSPRGTPMRKAIAALVAVVALGVGVYFVVRQPDKPPQDVGASARGAETTASSRTDQTTAATGHAPTPSVEAIGTAALTAPEAPATASAQPVASAPSTTASATPTPTAGLRRLPTATTTTASALPTTGIVRTRD
ncbi:MAG: protein kinase [Polyangiaceae bacterium]|nr:protein kinase [Polyangiaceae bacterium]